MKILVKQAPSRQIPLNEVIVITVHYMILPSILKRQQLVVPKQLI